MLWQTAIYTTIILFILYDTAKLINTFLLLSKLEKEVMNTTHSVMVANSYMQEEILNG